MTLRGHPGLVHELLEGSPLMAISFPGRTTAIGPSTGTPIPACGGTYVRAVCVLLVVTGSSQDMWWRSSQAADSGL